MTRHRLRQPRPTAPPCASRPRRWVAYAVVLIGVSGSACSDSSSADQPGEPSPEAGLPGDANVADQQAEADAFDDADGQTDPPIPPACKVEAQRVLDDVAYLASVELGGRAPGTEGNAMALAYAESVLEAAGLVPLGDAPSLRQAFPHDVWRLQDAPSLSVAGQAVVPGDAFTVFSYSGSASVEAEIVFAGYGITVPPFDASDHPGCSLDPSGYDDYEGVDATGKIVLVARHGPGDIQDIYDFCPGSPSFGDEPTVWRFEYKAMNASQHGAAAMLFVERDAANPGVWDAGLPAAYLPQLASLILDRAVADEALPDLTTWIDQIDTTLEPASTATGLQGSVLVSSVVESVEVDNLIGVIPGSDPAFDGQVAMFGAHVDHLGTAPVTGTVYPGADDNASGAATLLEAARVLSACVQSPARSVALALWNAEEDGLVGSCHFVEQEPTVALGDLHVLVNVDMVGAGLPGIQVEAGDLLGQRWVFDAIKGAASAAGLEHAVMPAPAYGGSDHVCFFNAGVPAVSLRSLEPHVHYHTPQDTLESLDPDTLTASAEVVLAAAVTFAQGRESTYFRCEGSCKQ